MKALVTGCAGFIGSHVSQRLLNEGIEVDGIDVMSDYYDPAIKRQNCKALEKSAKFRFVEADMNTADMNKLVEGVEYIYHLAAQPGVRNSWGTSFDVYIHNNILATQKLLEAAKTSKRLKQIIFASSSSVYGQTAAEKVTEDHPTRPFSPYGVTKLAAEHLCSSYSSNFGLPVVSFRLFTVYGPGQRPDMAFSKLLHAAYMGQPFTVFGDGTQERDFTYVDDVVDCFYSCVGRGTVTGIFNVGGGHVVTLKEVIAEVENITGNRVKTSSMPRQSGDVQRTSADIGRTANEFGYSPKFSVAEGLRLQAEYVRQHLAGRK